MSSQKEQQQIARMVRGMKIAGAVFFVGLNCLLFGNLLTAYQEGQKRGEILHQQREEKRKREEGQQKEKKSTLPLEARPEYIEQQVRKYKGILSREKAEESRQSTLS